MALMLGMLLWLASRNRAHCRALHSGGDTAAFALDDSHSQCVPGVPFVGAIPRAARSDGFALWLRPRDGRWEPVGNF
jgi:hypothetical protein